MAKRLQSKYSVCKKLNCVYKNLWGLQSKDYIRSVFAKKRKTVTSVGDILCIKQTLRSFYYNLKERALAQYVKIGVVSNSMTINKIVCMLESRLDSVLFRSCFVTSFNQARQLISHNFVKVNGLKVNFYSRKLKKGDFIVLNTKCLEPNTFLNTICSRSLPNHLELDLYNFNIVFLWDIKLKSVYYPININYSNLIRFFK